MEGDESFTGRKTFTVEFSDEPEYIVTFEFMYGQRFTLNGVDLLPTPSTTLTYETCADYFVGRAADGTIEYETICTENTVWLLSPM